MNKLSTILLVFAALTLNQYVQSDYYRASYLCKDLDDNNEDELGASMAKVAAKINSQEMFLSVQAQVESSPEFVKAQKELEAAAKELAEASKKHKEQLAKKHNFNFEEKKVLETPKTPLSKKQIEQKKKEMDVVVKINQELSTLLAPQRTRINELSKNIQKIAEGLTAKVIARSVSRQLSVADADLIETIYTIHEEYEEIQDGKKTKTVPVVDEDYLQTVTQDKFLPFIGLSSLLKFISYNYVEASTNYSIVESIKTRVNRFYTLLENHKFVLYDPVQETAPFCDFYGTHIALYSELFLVLEYIYASSSTENYLDFAKYLSSLIAMHVNTPFAVNIRDREILPIKNMLTSTSLINVADLLLLDLDFETEDASNFISPLLPIFKILKRVHDLEISYIIRISNQLNLQAKVNQKAKISINVKDRETLTSAKMHLSVLPTPQLDENVKWYLAKFYNKVATDISSSQSATPSKKWTSRRKQSKTVIDVGIPLQKYLLKP